MPLPIGRTGDVDEAWQELTIGEGAGRTNVAQNDTIEAGGGRTIDGSRLNF